MTPAAGMVAALAEVRANAVSEAAAAAPMTDQAFK
jgi:hypothetical protein